MVMFLVKRIAATLGVLLALTMALFGLQEVSGVDPAKAYVGANASADAVAAARERLGLDEPLVQRYLTYLNGLLHGDLQNSLRSRTPVADNLAQVLPASLELSAWVLGFSVLSGDAFSVHYSLPFRG
jgi:peptide/nickel transport system permease protein